MVWTHTELLEDLGLAPQNHRPYTKKKLHIDKGEIDPRAMAGLAMISQAGFDKDKALETLDMRYWVVHPDGRYELQHLIELDTETLPSGKLDIKSVHVLGREVSLHSNRNINNVLEAVRRIHVSLRSAEAELPNVAKIFEDCFMKEALGDDLPLPGFDTKQRIYFPAAPNFNIEAQGKKRPGITLPAEAFKPLAGMRKNTLDTDHSYMGRDFVKARGVIPTTGTRFETRSRFEKTGKQKNRRKLRLEAFMAEGDAANDSRRLLAAAKWKMQKAKGKHALKTEDTVYLNDVRFFDQSMLQRGFKETMGALGVLNRSHADMLNGRDYPRMLDHMAQYGLTDIVQSSSAPPPKGTSDFVVTSIGGNNLEEQYPGVGNDIGGNCKTAEVRWIDPKTKALRKCGVILDFGSYLIKNSSEWSMAHPDVVDKLKDCQHIFITHHHLDHLDGMLPYIRRGMLSKGHTVYLTPEVYEMLNEKLNRIGIKKDAPRRPKIQMLQGTDTVDITDENDDVRLTVLYGVDAVPHSAKDTPYVVYGREGDEILGSYQYLGDMRYDEEWFKINNSTFWDPVAYMREHYPALHKAMIARSRAIPGIEDKAVLHLRGLKQFRTCVDEITDEDVRTTIDNWHFIPTFAEIDGTATKREGRGATEGQVEYNTAYALKNWFYDLHAGLAMIGTNDGRRESLLRVANHTQRKMTAFGKAVEDIYRVANKWGVNPYLSDRPQAAERILEQLDQGTAPDQITAPSSSTYTGIKDYLAMHAAEHGLAPTEYKGRATKTVEKWFETLPPGKILAVLSGSQGNAIEFESMTYKLKDRRSLWDADPHTSRNARPAALKNWVLIFSQSAIPGNGHDQRKLIEGLADRGACVVETFDDCIRIHNPSRKLKRRILDDLIRIGRITKAQEKSIIEAGGSIFVEKFSLHASGHGRKGDMMLWLDKLQAKMFGMHHTDDPEAVNAGYDTIEQCGKTHPGAILKNGREYKLTNDALTPLGDIMPGIILSDEKAEPGKPYNTFFEVTRVVNINADNPLVQLGLRGAVGGTMETHFGTEDAEEIRRRTLHLKDQDSLSGAYNGTTIALPPRLYKGPKIEPVPDWNPAHPLFAA